MNVPAIDYLPPDRRAVAACANVPEFTFSPKAPKRLSRTFLCADCGQPLHDPFWVPGPLCDACHRAENLAGKTKPAPLGPTEQELVWSRKLVRTPRTVSEVERKHLNYQPHFETKVNTNDTLSPYGTVPAFHAMTFHDPHAELSWLMQTQMRDIALTDEEIAFRGISVASIGSSSQNDDAPLDIADDNERTALVPMDDRWSKDPQANHDARRYGTPDMGMELAPVIRRIEWERDFLACGQPNRIYIGVDETGAKYPTCTDRRWQPEQLVPYLEWMREAVAGRSGQDILEARERAHHYGALVLSLMSEDEQTSWMTRDWRYRFYLNEFASTNVDNELHTLKLLDAWREPVAERGPVELGFHGDGGDMHIDWDRELTGFLAITDEDPEEPGEYQLWPLTDAERAAANA